MELLQCLRIGIISSRFRLAFRTHRGHAQRGHVVTDGRRFACGIGNVHIVVENTHGKSELCQLTIIHDDIRLEASVLGGPHTGEVHTVFRPPIMLLQIT